MAHAHPDHLGAAERIHRETDVTVHVHAPEMPRARGEAKGASPFTLVPSLLPTMWEAARSAA
ncbi:MAG: MBL fold metallo-hydrolase [Solirubrobacterales bacterium]|nr:MBL fold metallo-hydrolase [Solirubrobacterales bacterium]